MKSVTCNRSVYNLFNVSPLRGGLPSIPMIFFDPIDDFTTSLQRLQNIHEKLSLPSVHVSIPRLPDHG